MKKIRRGFVNKQKVEKNFFNDLELSQKHILFLATLKYCKENKLSWKI